MKTRMSVEAQKGGMEAQNGGLEVRISLVIIYVLPLLYRYCFKGTVSRDGFGF